MPLDSPKEVATTEETEVLSEQTNIAPEAPVSHTRLATKEALEQKAPVPPAFVNREPSVSSKPTKWDELSAGHHKFSTGSYRGES